MSPLPIDNELVVIPAVKQDTSNLIFCSLRELGDKY